MRYGRSRSEWLCGISIEPNAIVHASTPDGFKRAFDLRRRYPPLSPVRPPLRAVGSCYRVIFFVRLFRIAKLRLVNTVMRQCIYPNIVYMHHRSVVTYSVLNFCVCASPRRRGWRPRGPRGHSACVVHGVVGMTDDRWARGAATLA